MQISKVYRAMLNAMGVTELEPEMFLTYRHDNSPIMVKLTRYGETDTLPVIIPTQETLEKDNDPNVVKFHPLCESPFTERSEIFNLLQVIYAGQVVSVAMAMVIRLVNLSCNMSDSSNYSNDTLKILHDFPSMRTPTTARKTLEYLSALTKSHSFVRGENAICRINVGRNKRDDIKALRWSELVVNVLEGCDDGEMRILGKKAPSAASYKTVKRAIEVTFGVESGTYKRPVMGTDSQTAPYFQALVKCTHDVLAHINNINEGLGKQGIDDASTDLDWYDELMTDPTKLAKTLPVNFDGNTGRSSNRDSENGDTIDRSIKTAVKPALKTTYSNEKSLPTQTDEKTDKESSMDNKTSASIASMLRDANKHKPRVAAEPRTETVEEESPVKKSSTLTVNNRRREEPRRPARDEPQHNGLRVKSREERTIHLHDSADQPLFDAGGKPVYGHPSDMPKGLFLIEMDDRGRPFFDREGNPELISVTPEELDDYVHQLRYAGSRNSNDPRQQYYRDDPRGGYPSRNDRNDPRQQYYNQPPIRPQYGNDPRQQYQPRSPYENRQPQRQSGPAAYTPPGRYGRY